MAAASPGASLTELQYYLLWILTEALGVRMCVTTPQKLLESAPCRRGFTGSLMNCSLAINCV